MRRLTLSLLLFMAFVTLGCAGHSSRHSSPGKINMCRSFPCGGKAISGDMVLFFEIDRQPDLQFVLTGTLTPRNVPEGTPVELAVLSFELARDVTLFDSFSFPIVSRDMRTPLHFTHRFQPSGGFDGVKFNWDVRYAQ